jgi:hypothetical protein
MVSFAGRSVPIFWRFAMVIKRYLFVVCALTGGFALSAMAAGQPAPVMQSFMECESSDTLNPVNVELFSDLSPVAGEAEGHGIILVEQLGPHGLRSRVVYTDVHVGLMPINCGGLGFAVDAYYRLSGADGHLRTEFCVSSNNGTFEGGGSALNLHCHVSPDQ